MWTRGRVSWRLTGPLISGVIHRGVRAIGSARCKDYREREGKLNSARNFIERRTSKLVAIGQ